MPSDNQIHPIHGSIEAINRQLRRTRINEERDLHRAAADGSRSDVVKLLNDGANIELQAAMGMRPLHYAAKTNNVGAVIALLGRRADVDAKDETKSTPLHLAAREGHLQIVKLLLGRGGADIEAIDDNIQTALHHAVICSSVEVVKELMDRNANTDAKDFQGWTPVRHVGEAEKGGEILALLLSS